MAAVDMVLDALGEHHRRALVELLADRDEASVSELVEATGLRQPQVSKHLKVLAAADLVAVRVDGRFRRYRLDRRGVGAAHDWFAGLDQVWHARFDALDALVSHDEAGTGESGEATPPTHDHRSEEISP